jgi:hypothetical protein
LSAEIAFLTSIYSRLVGDEVLAGLCGGTIRIFHRMAPPDPDFPYIVHKLVGHLVDGAVIEGEWLCDVWDYDTDAARAMQIGTRIKQILHGHVDKALNGAGLFFVRIDPVETDNHEVQRVSLRFEAVWPDTDIAQFAG